MSWSKFINEIGEIAMIPLDIERISQIVKLEGSDFPSYERICQYYQEEFKIKTLQSSRSKWHWSDKILLIWCMVKQMESQMRNFLFPEEEDFRTVAEALSISVEKLQVKWMSLLKTRVREAPWTDEENDLVRTLKSKYQKDQSWMNIAIEFNRTSKTKIVRYPKQIREHWNNLLDPSINKKEWTLQEKIILLNSVSNGCKKWSNIRKLLPGRTDNQIKNQYHAIMKNFTRRVVNKIRLIFKILQKCNSQPEVRIVQRIIEELQKQIQSDEPKYKKIKNEVNIEREEISELKVLNQTIEESDKYSSEVSIPKPLKKDETSTFQQKIPNQMSSQISQMYLPIMYNRLWQQNLCMPQFFMMPEFPILNPASYYTLQPCYNWRF